LPAPLHLLAGRTVAFNTFSFLARNAPWTLKEQDDESSCIKLA
jgi:hypothetical protein